MNDLKLLKNQREWEQWVKDAVLSVKTNGDIVTTPKEYPCYGYTAVISWAYEQEETKYWYLETLQELLNGLC